MKGPKRLQDSSKFHLENTRGFPKEQNARQMFVIFGMETGLAEYAVKLTSGSLNDNG